MTEGRKTGIFALIAGAVALLAWATTNRNRIDTSDVTQMIGKVLFEKFTDPVNAASLKIQRYDTAKEAFDDFEVSKDRSSGRWSIPSHDSYPADASKQVADASNLFIGLKVLDIASEKREEHGLYGVIAPDKTKENQGGNGVGMLVQLRDDKAEILADLIIGKEIDKKKRFARIPSEDVTYVVELETTPLSTDFKTWIEPDLLKLSSMDIENLAVRDYQIIPTNQGMVLSRNYEADLAFSSTNSQWSASRITTFEADPPVEKKIGENEQLNTTKLNDVRNTLDSLKISDVAKKPAGLAADLKGDKTKLTKEAVQSLEGRGFFPNPNQKDGNIVDFYSKSGELIATLKDGVQYLLRFGGAAGADINKAIEEGKEDTVSINRFLLVTVRLDESKFPEPQLERLPESVEELKALEKLKKAAESPVPSVPTDPSNIPLDNAPKTDNSPKSDEKGSEESKPEPAPAPAEPKKDQAANKNTRGFLVSAQAQEANAQEKSEKTENAPPATKAESDKEPTKPDTAQEPTEEEWKERLSAERERITKENQRKIDDRKDKLEAAKKKVAELNARFADWYYVISDADYNKLRVTLSDLIQPKAAATTPAAPSFGAPGLGAPGIGLPGLGNP